MTAHARVLDQIGMSIRARDVTMPRNRREAKQSTFPLLWNDTQCEEMAAMQLKEALEEMPGTDMPLEDIRFEWCGCKHLNISNAFVIRFRTLLFALVTFYQTFLISPKHSLLWLACRVFDWHSAADTNLTVHGADINVAYLDAYLTKPHYVIWFSFEWFIFFNRRV